MGGHIGQRCLILFVFSLSVGGDRCYVTYHPWTPTSKCHKTENSTSLWLCHIHVSLQKGNNLTTGRSLANSFIDISFIKVLLTQFLGMLTNGSYAVTVAKPTSVYSGNNSKLNKHPRAIRDDCYV